MPNVIKSASLARPDILQQFSALEKALIAETQVVPLEDTRPVSPLAFYETWQRLRRCLENLTREVRSLDTFRIRLAQQRNQIILGCINYEPLILVPHASWWAEHEYGNPFHLDRPSELLENACKALEPVQQILSIKHLQNDFIPWLEQLQLVQNASMALEQFLIEQAKSLLNSLYAVSLRAEAHTRAHQWLGEDWTIRQKHFHNENLFSLNDVLIDFNQIIRAYPQILERLTGPLNASSQDRRFDGLDGFRQQEQRIHRIIQVTKETLTLGEMHFKTMESLATWERRLSTPGPSLAAQVKRNKINESYLCSLAKELALENLPEEKIRTAITKILHHCVEGNHCVQELLDEEIQAYVSMISKETLARMRKKIHYDDLDYVLSVACRHRLVQMLKGD